jgi:hypothetical protein
MQGLLTDFGASPVDAPSFYLLQHTIYAYLRHLQRQRLIEHEIHDGRSLWRRR